MNGLVLENGFLSAREPLRAFPQGSPFAMLDELGHDLPSLLEDSQFRAKACDWQIPSLNDAQSSSHDLAVQQLYYVRMAFLASAYVNQIGQPRATVLPRSIAVPFCQVCRLLKRPAVLGYDGYVLYNWKKLNPNGALALGNIDSLQNFVHRYDEHWLIAIYVEIEHLAVKILMAIDAAIRSLAASEAEPLQSSLWNIAETLQMQLAVLRRLDEKCDLQTYRNQIRPYTRFFENVVYEDVDERPMNYRGDITAQSAILPALVAFLKIPHAPTNLVKHLTELRAYMPAEHRSLIEEIEKFPPIRPFVERRAFNAVLDAIVQIRELHYRRANEVYDKREKDGKFPAGPAYLQGLAQLIDETRAYMVQ